MWINTTPAQREASDRKIVNGHVSRIGRHRKVVLMTAAGQVMSVRVTDSEAAGMAAALASKAETTLLEFEADEPTGIERAGAAPAAPVAPAPAVETGSPVVAPDPQAPVEVQQALPDPGGHVVETETLEKLPRLDP